MLHASQALFLQATANETGTIKIAAEEAPAISGSSQQQNAVPAAAANKQDESKTLLPPSVQALRPDLGGTAASGTRPMKPRVALKDRMAAQSQRPAPEGEKAASQASPAFEEAANNRKQFTLSIPRIRRNGSLKRQQLLAYLINTLPGRAGCAELCL